MKLLRRIGLAMLVILAALCWIGPAVVVYFAKTAPAVTRVVPTQLKDLSTSLAPGRKLSYLGYEFEVPWSDLDESQTHLSEKPNAKTAWLCFRSGLKLFVVITPRERAVPGYESLKLIYEITPDKIHYWSLVQGWGYRDANLLLAKSAFLQDIGHPGGGSNPTETGIFNLRSTGYHGFQYGDPRSRPDVLQLRLYSNDGRVEIKFLQGEYDEPSGVTQPEINRIVQTLHKIPAGEIAISVR
ncbi:MAG: hypothetical protein WCF22_08460 [Candidatus Sulfotelmatobacter sp.]